MTPVTSMVVTKPEDPPVAQEGEEDLGEEKDEKIPAPAGPPGNHGRAAQGLPGYPGAPSAVRRNPARSYPSRGFGTFNNNFTVNIMT